jgi:hypothetical protein
MKIASGVEPAKARASEGSPVDFRAVSGPKLTGGKLRTADLLKGNPRQLLFRTQAIEAQNKLA